MQSEWDLLAIAAVMSTTIVVTTMGLWWLAGLLLRSVRSLYMSRYQVVPAFPVQLIDEGEGTYHVEGVMRATEEEIVWTIEAKTRANAIAKAELRGAVVTQVQKLAVFAVVESQPYEAIEATDHHPITSV